MSEKKPGIDELAANLLAAHAVVGERKAALDIVRQQQDVAREALNAAYSDYNVAHAALIKAIQEPSP